jgi:transposase
MNAYLEHLAAAHPGKKIPLIWDGAGWHGSKDLCIPPNVRCESLPPYSPELNPVERLWQWLRRRATRNRLHDSEEAPMDSLAATLRGLDSGSLRFLCGCSYL